MKKILFLCITLLIFNACKKEEGCTDPSASNYDSQALEDNGTCIYSLSGCTDNLAINYDSNANNDDGSCFYGEISSIINYSVVDGLLSDFIECIDVDINDNIWIGSSLGLQMYNGFEFVNYTSLDGLADNNIKVISSSNNGNIWVGTDFGISQFDGLNWITYDITNGLISNQIKSIDFDEDGIVWVGTNSGVSFYNGTSWDSYSDANSDLHWSGVNATDFSSNGDKWFASPLGGITHFDGSNFINYDDSDGLISKYSTDLLIDDQNNKWIGTASGISVLSATNVNVINYTKMYLLPPPDTLNPVVDLEIDNWGRIWVGIYVGYLSEGGVAYWNGNAWLDLDIQDGLAGSNIKDLSIDSNNNIWIATTSGISKVITQ